MDRTLNISEPQVLFHYPGDGDGLNYHHRVLLHKIGGGRWIVLSPDLELSAADLNVQRHIVLARNSAFPPDIEDECYTFDALSRNELDRQKRLARTMGSILDDSTEVATVDTTSWVIADPGDLRFGQVIPSENVQDITVNGSHGLIDWEGDVRYVREIVTAKIDEFKSERKEASSDIRTIGDHRDSQSQRFLSHSAATALLRQSQIDDWGFSGPRSTLDFCKAVLSGPGDMVSYHLTWVRNSGIGANTSIAHEHKSICETIRLALTRDQLDVSNLMSFEHLTRRLVVLEIATSRSPGAPDFAGLDVVSEAAVNQSGAAQITALNAWVTDRLKERANIQKQARLFKEEYGKNKQSGAEGDPKPKKFPPKKKGDGKGGGASGSAGTA